jgi:hypothetical protein
LRGNEGIPFVNIDSRFIPSFGTPPDQKDPWKKDYMYE